MSTPTDTPRTDAAYFQHGATMYSIAGEMKLVERELAAAKAERDLAITRLASILWSGAIDNQLCGDVQKWADDYTAELTRLRAEVERLKFYIATTIQPEEHAKVIKDLRALSDQLSDNLSAVGAAYNAEKARAEKAEADIARLDWLDENMGYSGGGSGGTYTFFTPADVECGMLRDAIDAAMKEASK